MENSGEIDPWANMGNMGSGNVSGETSAESLERAEKWENAMSDAPEFNEGLADASAIINYGINAAAREIGVEQTVQAIKHLNINSCPENPIKGIFDALGIDTPAEFQDYHDEQAASRVSENSFRSGNNHPTTMNRSMAGAVEAIRAMKELISEVEGADPAYEDLRQNARALGKGIFETAVFGMKTPGLVELFGTLEQMRSSSNEIKADTEAEVFDEKDGDENIIDFEHRDIFDELSDQEKKDDIFKNAA